MGMFFRDFGRKGGVGRKDKSILNGLLGLLL